jgi:curved DNA-binding protein CbpA
LSSIKDLKVLRKQYLKLAMTCHPDKDSSAEATANFQALDAAYLRRKKQLNRGVLGTNDEAEGSPGKGDEVEESPPPKKRARKAETFEDMRKELFDLIQSELRCEKEERDGKWSRVAADKMKLKRPDNLAFHLLLAKQRTKTPKMIQHLGCYL